MRRKKSKLFRYLATLVSCLGLGTFLFLRFTSSPAEAAWYNDSWGFRKKIVIDHTKVSGDQTNFPVLVSLTDLNLSKAQSNGNDILFADSTGGTKLDHEIEKFDQSKGTLVAWVRIASLSSSVDTTIYMYYGNSGAASQQNKTGVWDNNYIMVQHLSETSGNHNDSNNSHNSSAIAVTKQGTAAGKANGADEFNGSSDKVTIPDADDLSFASDMTIEAWVKLDQLAVAKGDDNVFLAKRSSTTTASMEYLIAQNNSSGNNRMTFIMENNNATPGWFDANYTGALATGTWYHVVGVRASNVMTIYVNGTGTTGNTFSGSTFNSDENLYLGNYGSSSPVDGVLDEIRISNSARSAGWITTTYNSINSPSTFLSSAAEEKSKGPVLNWSFANGSGTIAYDTSPLKNNGTIANAVWQPENMCPAGKCLSFNGTSTVVSTAAVVPNVQSVSLWVKPITTTQSILDLDGGSHKISISSGAITATGFSNVYVDGRASTTLAANKWQHLEATTSTAFSTTTITLGQISAAYFNGFIDEFKLYDYIRSASQIKQDAIRGNSSSGSSASLGKPSTEFLNQDLVGYWKMDEPSWIKDAVGTVLDASGNDNHGAPTCSGTCTISGVTAGKFGNGGSFDGTDDYVQIPDNILYTQIYLTVSIWAKFDQLSTAKGTQQYLIRKTATGDPYRSYDIYNSSADNKFYARIYDQASNSYTLNSTTVMQAGVWYHISLVENGKSVILYINGLPEATTSWTGTSVLDSNSFLYIGGISGSYSDSSIDDIRIYNRALSPAEVTQLYNWAPGPVGHWKLDENTGTTEYDSSSHNFNMSNSVAGSIPTWVPGKFGSALNFDGVDDHILYPDQGNQSALEPQTNMTIEAWINMSQLPSVKGNSNYVVHKLYENTPWYSYLLGVNTSNKLSFDWVNTGLSEFSVTSNTSIATSVWTHIAAVKNGTSMYVYINGVNDSSNTVNATGTLLEAGGELYISTFNALSFAGKIDDVRIYDYARTPAQILEDMAAGQPANKSPVASWDFNENNGTTAYDSSVSQNNLTLNSASWSSTGKQNSAWNGTGATWLTRADDADFDFAATDDFSISTWFKSHSSVNPASAVEYLLAKGTITNTGTAGYAMYANTDGTVSFGIKDDTAWGASSPGTPAPDDTVTTSKDIYDGNWHNITVAKTGTSRLDLYLDGRLDNSDTSIAATGTLANSIALFVGNHDAVDNGHELNGDLDNLKVYRYAVTADDAKNLYNQNSSVVMGAQSSSASSEGLSAYWKMDDPSITSEGQTIVDSAGTSNVGTLYGDNGTGDNGSGMDCSVGGKFNYGCTFDGTDDYISFADNAIYSPSSITISVWAKFNQLSTVKGSNQYVYRKAHSLSPYRSFELYNNVANNDFKAVLYDASSNQYSLDSTTAMQINTWYLLTLVKDDKKVIFYVNGVAESSLPLTAAGVLDANGSLFLGNDSNTNFMNGYLDDFRIYSRALSPAEVQQLYEFAPDPVGYWKMDENRGTTAYDSSGHGSNGIFNGTIPWVIGKSGNAVTTNLTTYLNVTDPSDGSLDFGAGSDFSLEAWIKTTNSTTSMAVINKNFGSATPGYRMRLTTAGKVGCEASDAASGTTSITGNAVVADGTWHHIACLYNGTASTPLVYSYVDGGYDNSGSFTHNASHANAVDLKISGATTGFQGSIDEAKIYNYLRSPGQLAWDYNGGAPFAQYDFDDCSGAVLHDTAPKPSRNSTTYNGTIIPGDATGNNDAVGNCNDGNSGTTNTMWNAGTVGKYSSSLSFDGTNDYVTANSITSKIAGRAFTISGWAKTTQSGSTSPELFAINTAAYGNQILYYQASDGTMSAFDFINTFTGKKVINDGNWHHFAIVLDDPNDTLKTYVDGTLDISAASAMTIGATDLFSIGQEWDVGPAASNFWNGQIDSVKIFNYALTPTQIKTLYNNNSSVQF